MAVGFSGYLLLNLAVYGDPLAFIRIQNEHWFKSLAWPWVGIGGVIDRLDSGSAEDIAVLGVAELVAIGLGLAGTVVAAASLPPLVGGLDGGQLDPVREHLVRPVGPPL